MHPTPHTPRRPPRRWLSIPAIGLALVCLVPLVTAAPASAHDTPVFYGNPAYVSQAINFCVTTNDAMNHNSWYAITYSRNYFDSSGIGNCGGYHGEPTDGARLDIWWYKNGDGHGGFAYRVHWGFFHNPTYDDHAYTDYGGPTSCVDGTCGPGYWSMDALHTAADWWGNFQGGWAINAIHHYY